MKKGTSVLLFTDDGEISGVTIENESGVMDSGKRVIRIRWEDGSESIEDVDKLMEY